MRVAPPSWRAPRARARAGPARVRAGHRAQQPGDRPRQGGHAGGRDEDEPPHPLGTARREEDRDRAAHRMADEVVRSADAGLVEAVGQALRDLP
jgi:hypothetical protein